MTGVIAGHVEGTYPIWDLAVSHVDMRPGYYSLTPMPITYEERRFCAKRLPAGTYCITKPGGYANQTVRLGPGEIVDDIIFSRNDVKVRLRIEGFSGRVPIGSRISVKLTTLYDSDSSYSIVKSVVIPEDRALSFRMPRGHDLQLTVRTPQSGGLLMYRVPFSAAVGDVLDIPLTLDNWPKIAGKVVDAAGEMVSGVTISLLETLDPVRRDRSSYATNELMQVCSGNRQNRARESPNHGQHW